jgi:hypothetical protein
VPHDRQDLERLTAGIAAVVEDIRQGGPPLADRLPGTFAGAEREIPETWRRRLDPHGRGLTIPQVLGFRAARRHLIGRPACTPARTAPRVRPGRRVSHARRPGHRRSGSTSRTASADPPDDGEPPGDPTFTAQLAVAAR